MMLTPELRRALDEALAEAFPNISGLKRLFRYRLDKSLMDISGEYGLERVRDDVISWAESHDRVEELIYGALQENSSNRRLIALAGRVTFLPVDASQPVRLQLERMIDQGKMYLNPVELAERLRRACAAVCRVEVAGRPLGTGFLVAPDLVLTNHHVVEPVIARRASPADVVLRFDYYVAGAIRNVGREVRLAQEWLADASPPSPADDRMDDVMVPSEDELDHALLRLAEPIGALPVGASPAGSEAGARGFLEVGTSSAIFRRGAPLHILQHPLGERLKLGMDSSGIIGLNANAIRLRYRTNTEAGSSGSPCFDERFDLVALHQAGDPNFGDSSARAFNQGIPIAALVRRWTCAPVAGLSLRAPST